jgi:anti-anti-sigma factor
MSWRSSPFFEQQFKAITALGGVSEEDFGYILNESDDEPLLVLAKGLEERGDPRAQYIRDMCDLAMGEVRPLAPTLSRVITFERSLDTEDVCFYHSIGKCVLTTPSVTRITDIAPQDTLRAELLEFANASGADLNLIVDLGSVEFITSEFISVLLRMRRGIQQNGGQFQVLIVTELVRMVFTVCPLNAPVFRLASDVDEAISLANTD